MRAAWFEHQGEAVDVLEVGEVALPEPAAGEVRIRLTVSGVNPGDVKKRQSWLNAPMAFGRIVPHSDGAGRIEAVGAGVDPARVGSRVWVFGAQSYRPLGTAAQATVVPSAQAVDLPDGVSDSLGACLGIPGITAHRAVFGDGDVGGATVLVHGVLGAVGSLAAQLATWGGATVIGTVRRGSDVTRVQPGTAAHVVALDQDDPVQIIQALAPLGVDRVVEVALAANVDLDAAVIGPDAVIAAYATTTPRTEIPFWPLLFANTTLRLLGSDDFPLQVKVRAGADLTAAAADGALHIPTAPTFPLEDIAAAHQAVEAGAPNGRVLLHLP